jgi:hypothetical protein
MRPNVSMIVRRQRCSVGSYAAGAKKSMSSRLRR